MPDIGGVLIVIELVGLALLAAVVFTVLRLARRSRERRRDEPRE